MTSDRHAAEWTSTPNEGSAISGYEIVELYKGKFRAIFSLAFPQVSFSQKMNSDGQLFYEPRIEGVFSLDEAMLIKRIAILSENGLDTSISQRALNEIKERKRANRL